MEAKKLSELKGSEIHKIVAAVLEVMEKAGFESDVNVTLEETKEENVWSMVFNKKSCTLAELLRVKNELGENYEITILPPKKQAVFISIQAPSQDFINKLGGK